METYLRDINETALLSAAEEKLETEEEANLLARQGVRHITANQIQVLDEAGKEVPWDGSASGEIVLSGNTLFSGYYRKIGRAHV